MAYGVLLSAEYEDGFVLTEKKKDDESPYVPGKNTYNAIVNHHPAPHHGRLVRFIAVSKFKRLRKKTYVVDWRSMWDKEEAEPVYYRNMERSIRMDGTHDTGPVCLAHFFGYRYKTADGVVEDITKID